MTDPKQTLLVTRIVWGALLAGQLMFLGVIVAMGRVQAVSAPLVDPQRMLFLVSAAFTVVAIGMGYFVRMQTYKAGWQGDAIRPASYFTGNLLLLALLEGASLLALVVTMLHGALWPTIAPAVVAMMMQVVNFPNGRAMEPASPRLQ
jgi:F0F1-type ATP synthase membrane subunit c/vacuolar-type H+-ATPase subunit K